MKRFRSEKGMTLSETLMAVLIMSLVTLAIAAGVTAGMRVYTRIKEKSEAQTLLATNVAALSDYLEKGSDISIQNSENTDAPKEIHIGLSEVSGTEVKIYNKGDKGIFVDYLDQDGNLIKLNNSSGANGAGESSNSSDIQDASQPLISEKDNVSNLYATFSEAETDKDITTFTVNIFNKSNNSKPVVSQDVKIRSMVQIPEGDQTNDSTRNTGS